MSSNPTRLDCIPASRHPDGGAREGRTAVVRAIVLAALDPQLDVYSSLDALMELRHALEEALIYVHSAEEREMDHIARACGLGPRRDA